MQFIIAASRRDSFPWRLNDSWDRRSLLLLSCPKARRSEVHHVLGTPSALKLFDASGELLRSRRAKCGGSLQIYVYSSCEDADLFVCVKPMVNLKN